MNDAAIIPAAGGAAAAADPVPVVFRAAGSWCFGWFHAARGAARGMGVVLCRPFGYEAICSYRTYTELAGTLAGDGFDVMRFDYHGTGDSAGDDCDPARVAAWLASITAAVGELRRRGSVERVALFGMRLGATLAVRAAADLGGVDALVLWAPVGGRAFMRELRAAGGVAGSPHGDDAVEALGYRYTAQTIAELKALDEWMPQRPVARRLLVIGRDDMPVAGSLPPACRAAAMETTRADWPGYAAMMVEPHEAVIAHATLRSIGQWLGAPQPAHCGTPEPGWVARPHEPVAEPVESVVEGVRETPLAFGAAGDLFGILAEPVGAAVAERRSDTAVLMLSVGGNHRIGPNRNYVRFSRALAAAGYRALRLDLAGVGDSRTGAGFSRASMYSRSSVADVRAAMDALSDRGCKRFWLLGICSGSFVALQTALVDARVAGQILMNSRLLEWEGKAGGWDDAMQNYYKSLAFYRRSLLNPQVYWRMLRGQVDVNGIAGRWRLVMQARWRRIFERLLRWKKAEPSLLARVRGLGARGVDTLMVIGEEDDGRDYVEFHFGTRGRYLRRDPHFAMVLVPAADHTFSRSRSQQIVLAAVRDHLDARTSPNRGAAPVCLNDPKMVRAG